jgi:hypothetical protein
MLTASLTSGLATGLARGALLLGGAHGILQHGLGVLLLHLAVQRHHTHVPLLERRAQCALATRLLALLTSFSAVGGVGGGGADIAVGHFDSTFI